MACVTKQHQEFLALLNQLRVQYELMPLRTSAILTDAALEKAGQLAVRDASLWNGDPHTIDGVTADELIEQHGYPENTWSGENLCYGVDTAQEAFDLWYGSPPHRANMLNPNYSEVGIAGPIGGPWTHPNDVFDVWVNEFGGSRTEAAKWCDRDTQESSPQPEPRPPDKPTRPTTPRVPPPRNVRRRRRRRLRWLNRLLGRE